MPAASWTRKGSWNRTGSCRHLHGHHLAAPPKKWSWLWRLLSLLLLLLLLPGGLLLLRGVSITPILLVRHCTCNLPLLLLKVLLLLLAPSGALIALLHSMCISAFKHLKRHRLLLSKCCFAHSCCHAVLRCPACVLRLAGARQAAAATCPLLLGWRY